MADETKVTDQTAADEGEKAPKAEAEPKAKEKTAADDKKKVSKAKAKPKAKEETVADEKKKASKAKAKPKAKKETDADEAEKTPKVKAEKTPKVKAEKTPKVEAEPELKEKAVEEETPIPSEDAAEPADLPEPITPQEQISEKPKPISVPRDARYQAVGRRKASVAVVYLTKGDGTIAINKRVPDEYMLTGTQVYVVKQPLELTGTTDLFNIKVSVRGGGLSGQAGAIRHAVSRALLKYNPDLRAVLKKAGFLTRDARVVERKKYGQVKARKRFQFSKR